MTEQPRCSVVIAAHDSESTITRTLQSVRLQTVSDWEAIVVDDGSTDRTVEVVEAIGDPRIRVVSQANGGPAAARNAGLERARGRFVSTLDSDDLWLPGYLAELTSLLERSPAAGVAYLDAWVLDDATGRIRKKTAMAYQHPPVPPPSGPAEFFEELLRRNFVYNSVTLRREVVEAVGGYDERLRTAEDWELWLRIAAAGVRFVRCDALLAVYRLHAGSLSSDGGQMLSGFDAVCRVIVDEWDMPAATKARVRERATAARRRAGPRVPGFPNGDPLHPARLLKRRIERRTLWHRVPPPELAPTLAAIDGG